tara:strand:+ start:1704 stop:2225 length:522 start_codon:yes stop_codon:yes gene_type:complete
MKKQIKVSNKQRRAFAYLMLREKFTVKEMAALLDEPLSTMQKPDNAFKRLNGVLGAKLKAEALDSLRLVDMGLKQVDAVNPNTDHKMVSDLVAMRWAIKRLVKFVLANDGSGVLERQAHAKGRLEIREKYQQAIDRLTESFDAVLAHAPSDKGKFQEALDEMTDAVIALEAIN